MIQIEPPYRIIHTDKPYKPIMRKVESVTSKETKKVKPRVEEEKEGQIDIKA